jgi:hypothetical protein
LGCGRETAFTVLSSRGNRFETRACLGGCCLVATRIARSIARGQELCNTYCMKVQGDRKFARSSPTGSGQPQSRWLEPFAFQLMFWRGFAEANPYGKTGFRRGQACLTQSKRESTQTYFQTKSDFAVALHASFTGCSGEGIARVICNMLRNDAPTKNTARGIGRIIRHDTNTLQ